MTTRCADLERGSLTYIHDDTVFLRHQIEGVRDLSRRTSFLLADDMGLGKSLQALAVAAVDFEQGWASRVLVVCPATLKGNWLDEVEKFTSFDAVVLAGGHLVREAIIEDFEIDGRQILIVNYEQVKPHLVALNDLGFDIVILDEAHYIKGHKSVRTKAALGLRAKRFFLLTGTPMLNQVNELWPLLHRIDPIEYPAYWTFTHRYCVYGGFKDKQIVGVKHQAELKERLQSVMLRRLKKDVLDLPPKTIIEIYVDKHPAQAALITKAKEELKIALRGQDIMEIANPMVLFLRQWQILSTPANLGAPDDSYKLDLAVEKAQEVIANGRPVVMFTRFRPTQDCLEDRLAAVGIAVNVLNGAVPVDLRQMVVNAWTENAAEGNPRVLLCMLQLAVGINLVAADTAIFVDELTVPKLNEQAEDRLDRIGQTLPVTIIRIRTRKSIEQRIAKLLETKSDIFGQMVENRDLRALLLEALMADDE